MDWQLNRDMNKQFFRATAVCLAVKENETDTPQFWGVSSNHHVTFSLCFFSSFFLAADQARLSLPFNKHTFEINWPPKLLLYLTYHEKPPLKTGPANQASTFLPSYSFCPRIFGHHFRLKRTSLPRLPRLYLILIINFEPLHHLATMAISWSLLIMELQVPHSKMNSNQGTSHCFLRFKVAA